MGLTKYQKAKTERLIEEQLVKGYTPVEIAQYLNETGVETPGKKAWTGTHVKRYIPKIEARWSAQTDTAVASLRASQHAEIRAVKTVLHERGDYRTLGTYIRMESELLGTNAPKESEATVNHNLHMTVEHRVAALQAASEVEKKLLGSVVEEYEVIDVEGVFIHEPSEGESL